jgi:hypothetical protein
VVIEGQEIVTHNGAVVELQLPGGAKVSVGPNRELLLNDEFFTTATPEHSENVISSLGAEADKVIQALNAGKDPFEGLEDPAAGLTGGGLGDQTHDFVRLVRVLEEVTPVSYSYSTSGTGGIGHLQMELYKSLTGTFVTHIPYRGAGPALNDTVAGQVPMIFDNLPSALPFIKENRLVPIVVAAPQRVAALPNVPTFKEVGLEPVNRMAYYGIVGPKGLPKDVVDKVNAAVRKALEDPAVKKRIEDTGSIVVGNTPEQFAEQIKAEFSVYKDVVAKQKLTLD